MKKIVYCLFALILFLPLMKVNAIDCGGTPLLDSDDTSFTCNEIDGETLTFLYNNKDVSEYFEYDGAKIKLKETKDLEKLFDVKVKQVIIQIKDNSSTSYISFLNSNYVVPPTSTTTTTTVPAKKTYTVIFDYNNDSGEKSEKSCSVTTGSTCSVTMPTLEDENFTGWGTAKTCKNGSSGLITVKENRTYYACYKDQEQTTSSEKPLLKTLKLLDDTSKELDFGVFNIKKMRYEVSVLYEVSEITVDATYDEGVTLEVEGNKDLKVGENEISIKLKDNNNNETIYSIVVNKLNEGESLVEEHYLSKLNIGGYPIKFDKTIFSYVVKIDKDVSSLILEYDTEIESDEVTELGNKDLENNSEIRLIVKGESGKGSVYSIRVLKDEQPSLLIFIIIGLIGVIIISLIILIIIKKKGKNNNKKPKAPKTKKNKKEDEGILTEQKDNIEVLNF